MTRDRTKGDGDQGRGRPVTGSFTRPGGLGLAGGFRPGGRPGGWGGPHALTMPVQKARDVRGTLRRLLPYFRPYAGRLVVVALASALSTGFGILSPRLIGDATTQIFIGVVAKLRAMGVIGAQRTGGEGLAGNGAAAHAAVPPAGGEAAQPAGTATVHAGASVHAAAPVHAAGVNFHALLHIIIWLAVVYVLSALFGYVQQYMMAGIAQRMVYNLRREVHEKLSRLPLSFFDSRPHGEVLSRFINDFDNIANTLQQSLTQLISSGITFLGVVVMMLTISPLMTLVTVLTLPLSLLVTRSIARRSQRYFIAQQASLGELNGHVEELYTGHAIIKAFSHEQRSIARFQAINQSLYEAGWRAQFISGIIMPLMNSIGNLGYVLVSVIGGVLVTKRAIQIGDVQAFIQYARQFTQPITQLSSIANIIQSTIASAERVFELLDEPEEQPGPAAPVALDDARGAVRLEDVTFGYNASDPVIQNLNIDVQPGQTIAIVGPTGAGKTTLVNLLMRFYEIDAGHIRVDGVDIRDLRRGDLRSLFGMVLQDAWLFHGTIRDNIAYGREGATEEAVVQAAVAAQADHFIRTLPDGYDTVLNEEASNLSQGQKQLLTIARAILRNPTILILDEATSNVDSRTEVLIQKAMQELMKGRTSFVIAHRLSTIREADLILVMNHGRLVEQGTHAELLARGGFYAELYNSQFAGVPV